MKKVFSLILSALLVFELSLPAFSMTKTYNGENIKVERKTRHLHSRLSKKYTGYEYIITNTSNAPVTLESVTLTDNSSGHAAYNSVKRTGLGAAGETLGWGLGLVLPTLTLSLIGAVVACPFIIAGSLAGNLGAKAEGKRYDKTISQTAIVLEKKPLILKVIAPHRHAPNVTFIYSVNNSIKRLVAN